MSSMLGKTSDYTRCERNMSKNRMMWRHWQPLPLKASKFSADVIELGEKSDACDTEEKRYCRR